MSATDLGKLRQIAEEVMESRLSDGYVLLQTETGQYYGLDALGSELWDAMKRGRTPADFVTDWEGDLNVSREQFAKDIARLIEDLENCRLIKVAAT